LLDRLSLVRTRPIAPSKGFIRKKDFNNVEGAFPLNSPILPPYKGGRIGIFSIL
jgi:hypothetical protein